MPRAVKVTFSVQQTKQLMSKDDQLESSILQLLERKSKQEEDEYRIIHKDTAGFPMIGVVTRLLDDRVCQRIIDAAEQYGFEIASQVKNRFYAHRRNGRISINSPAIAKRLFETQGFQKMIREFGICEVDGMNIAGLNANIRLYRYELGDSFGVHVDESVKDESGRQISKFTLLLYLQAAEQGGETRFYPSADEKKEEISISPEKGLALIHAHGSRCLNHEGASVVKGVKYLLRSDLMYNLNDIQQHQISGKQQKRKGKGKTK
jgi:hypothetical protein